MKIPTLEQDVPPPQRAQYSLVGVVRSMKVGDSFILPVERRKVLQYTIWYHKKNPKYKDWVLITKTIEEKGKKVVRCWRLA